MKKSCKIIKQYTTKPSHIYEVPWEEGLESNLNYSKKLEEFDIGNTINVHLYILSEDKIEEEDWFAYKDNFLDGTVKSQEDYDNAKWNIKRCDSKEETAYTQRAQNGMNAENGLCGCYKVIATTDKSLWKRVPHPEGSVKGDLPYIPKSFIEEYCKNPVDEVLVEYINVAYFTNIDSEGVGDVIPKLNNNEIIIHPVEEKMYTREELITFAKKYGGAVLNATGVDNDGESCYCTLDRDKWIEENL